jgi:hypothetical protein
MPVEGWDFCWFDGRATEPHGVTPTQDPLAGRRCDRCRHGRRRGVRLGARARLSLPTSASGERTLGAQPGCPSPPQPIGVRVVHVSEEAPLPCRDGSFDLVVSRHPVRTDWAEVARILRPGGGYLSQQVGAGSSKELTDLLTGPQPGGEARKTTSAIAGAEGAGLEIRDLRRRRCRSSSSTSGPSFISCPR